MRPKKAILLFCANENRCRELRFMLEVRGYLVVDMEDEGTADCALVIANPISSMNAAYAIAERDRDMPLLVMVASGEEMYYPIGARFVVVKASTVVLLEFIKLAVSRKRGPKKGGHRAVGVGEPSLPTSVAG